MGRNSRISFKRVSVPLQHFIEHEKSGGIVLGLSVLLALLMANSPWSADYFHFFEHNLGLYFDGKVLLEYTLHEWINDGLMAVFFFVVGLELKREIIGGELSNFRKAMLPIAAALGGMLLPAGIYVMLNPTGDVHNGWGIPMATDIAFALGVLYLVGRNIPIGVKVFLTALAIVDDLGAVLVIALFYTSDISVANLLLGLGFVGVMFVASKLGVRSLIFYAVIGIGGVWVAFLLSGIHATIAAVLAAFTIPANVILDEGEYIEKNESDLRRFKALDPDRSTPALTGKQVQVLEDIRTDINAAIPPLQRLEHAMEPLVTFVILPVFALANAGVDLSVDLSLLFNSNVVYGVVLGLLVGKPLGIALFSYLLIRLKFVSFPEGMDLKRLIGIGFLGGIGFTMSLFINSLAFRDEMHLIQAKVGILAGSLICGLIGFLVLRNAARKPG